MNPELQIQIFAPPIVVGIFFLLSFGLARRLSNPLTLLQKRMLAFGTMALLGFAYLILWQKEIINLIHSHAIWIIALAGWIVISWIVVSKIKFRDPEPGDDQI